MDTTLATRGHPLPGGGTMEHLRSRQHVVEMCRTLLERGYLKATEGNTSVRVPGYDRYAVTPSNYDYARMRPEDIAIVDFAGKQVPETGGSGVAALGRGGVDRPP